MTETQTTINNPASPTVREPLDRLCARLELGWVQERNHRLVDQLAAAHPRYARSLYDFFALLMAVELDVAEIVKPLAAGGRSLLRLLTEQTSEKATEIARKMEVPYPFLQLVQRHAYAVPKSVRQELAARAERAWGCNRNAAYAALEHPFQEAIAASRDTPYANETLSFAELVKRAKLNAKERKYWLALAADDDEAQDEIA
jgi:hypothetical protein